MLAESPPRKRGSSDDVENCPAGLVAGSVGLAELDH
jgi:hypothetical protein